LVIAELFIKIYRTINSNILSSLKNLLINDIKGLDVRIDSINFSKDMRFVFVSIEGEDSEAAKAYLEDKYGTKKLLEELKPGDVIKGYIANLGNVGYGIYIDIGLDNYRKDALIPLYELRKALVNGVRISTRKIAFLYGFVENFPMRVVIERITQTLNGKRNIYAALDRDQIKILKIWMKQGYEKVIVTGTTRQEIRKAIIKTGHLRDIITIERIGFLEHVIVCKRDTDAPGIIAEIGPKLPFAKLGAFRPTLIKDIIAKSKK